MKNNHEQFDDLINQYIDGTISELDERKLQKHLEECDGCTIKLEDYKYLNDVLADLEEKELPDGFEEELHHKLLIAKEEISTEKIDLDKKSNIKSSKKNKIFNFRNAGLVAAASILIIASFSTQMDRDIAEDAMMVSATEEFSGADMDMPYMSKVNEDEMMISSNAEVGEVEMMISSTAEVNEVEMMNSSNEGYSEGEIASSSIIEIGEYKTERMIIKSVDMGIQTTDYDKTLDKITNFSQSSGGYVEFKESYYRQYKEVYDEDSLKAGYVTIRIPVEHYNTFMINLDEYGDITRINEHAEDITKSYRDTAEEIANLEIAETRYREILQGAETVEDILKIENELTRIRGQINSYKNQMGNWEDLVSLTTISISLEEVEVYNGDIKSIDKSLFAKGVDSLNNSITAIKSFLENIFISIFYLLPIAAILAVVGVIIYVIAKNIKKRGRKYD